MMTTAKDENPPTESSSQSEQQEEDQRERDSPSSSLSSMMTMLTNHIPSSRQEWFKYLSIVIIPIVATGHLGSLCTFIIRSIWNIVLTCIGVMLGLGLGLGLATHVHDRLEHLWQLNNISREGDNDDFLNDSMPTTPAATTKRTSRTSVRKEHHHKNPNYSNSNNSLISSAATASSTGSTAMMTASPSATTTTTSTSVDNTVYASLMTSAGYDVSDGIRRGQIIRSTSDFFQNFYKFTKHADPHTWIGPQIMAAQWPHLPSPIRYEIGRFIEFLMRDFVAIWYCIVDSGCPYRNEKEHRKQQLKQQQDSKGTQDSFEPDQDEPQTQQQQQQTQNHHPHITGRAMVWSTAVHRPIPMMNAMYHSLAIVFGNLSSRVEHVNIFQLLLLKWTKVLSHSFKVYRQLHKSASQKLPPSLSASTSQKSLTSLRRSNSTTSAPGTVAKESTTESTRSIYDKDDKDNINNLQSKTDNRINKDDTSTSNNATTTPVAQEGNDNDQYHQQQQQQKRRRKRPHVSEMQMAKEFLLAGKLHQAITFGMDVPSLLFADADGRDCGVGGGDKTKTAKSSSSSNNNNNNKDAQGASSPTKSSSPSATTTTTTTAEDILEQRLFSTNILSECELDYNRVLSSRFVRLLLPRSEFSSPIISTLMTEMLASCILCPIMGLFAKDYVNSWICMGIDMTSGDSSSKDSKEAKANKEKGPQGSDETNASKVEREQGTTTTTTPLNTESFSELDHRGSFETEFEDDDDDDDDEFDEEIFQENDGEDGLQNDDTNPMLSLEEQNNTIGESSIDGEKELIVPLLSESLADLQRYLDFDECREARAQSYELDIDWDDPGCQEAVRRLVLILEAALLNGCRNHPRKMKRKEMNHDDDDNHDVKNDWIGPASSNDDNDDDALDDKYDKSTLFAQHPSLSQVLMEMTSDIDMFESRINAEEKDMGEDYNDHDDDDASQNNEPSPCLDHNASTVELSTLRTLIAAWLHTGQIHHIMSILCRAHQSVLIPYYHNYALLRNERINKDFLKQLKALDGVDVLVDTTAVVSNSDSEVIRSRNKVVILKDQEHQGICTNDVPFAEQQESTADIRNEAVISDLPMESPDVSPNKKKSDLQTSPSTGGGSPLFKASLTGSVLDVKDKFSRLMGENAKAGHAVNPHSAELSGLGTASAVALSQRFYTGSSTPKYIDFNRNEAWAGSLRSERIRKLQSWAAATAPSKERDSPEVIYRKNGIAERDVLVFLDVHRLARLFYANTSLISIRNGVRRNEPLSENISQNKDERTYISLLAVEPVCPRRRIEVPDDDSSFLLRAQTRTLNPVGVHRDQRIHDLSYLCFAAIYEEPASIPGDTRYRGGRYIRNCLMRYFPNGRNASISISPDARKLDNRKHAVPDDVGNFTDRTATPVLSQSFLRERYICKKWYQKGAAPRSSSILTSTTMEATDFSATPRSGKAIDFAYRMSLFEYPTVDLGGKKFMVRDSAAEGPHRTDASALEISDPSLSVALIVIGNELGSPSNSNTAKAEEQTIDKTSHPSNIEMGADGYPILWLKSKTKEGVVVKPYRTSYVRAALLISSTRQDAQMKCLVKCICSGSARDATKERIEEELWPTFKLLEYASSPVPDKQSTLLRDLKFGINHIDRDQLRRNGLLVPRYPTVIQSIDAVVEEAVHAKDAVGVSVGGVAPNSMLYKIRVVATVTLDVEEGDISILKNYYSPDSGDVTDSTDDHQNVLFREEWVVYRSYKEFTHLHKHLKSQVSPSETFAAQASARRLVDAATAAFTHGGGGTTNALHRNRKALIPSLGQANKAGALEFTAKAIQKRQKILDGYLEHLLSPTNMLKRCPEVLLFIGAFNAFPPEVRTGAGPVTIAADSLGRTEMVRTVVKVTKEDPNEVILISSGEKYIESETSNPRKVDNTNQSNKEIAITPSLRDEKSASNLDVGLSPSPHAMTDSGGGSEAITNGSSTLNGSHNTRNKKRKIHMKPAIKAKIEKVPLGQVRNALFELVRYQFDFDNASFFRSRMFSALKTMSFAVTSSSEFRKMLYEAHVKHVNPDALGGLVKMLLDILWPDGVFFDSKPPLTPRESQTLSDETLQKLTSIFPEQLQSVLGQEITNDGMEMLHEMLQNRLVLRSMAYMLFDLMWLEIFPELQDVLTGGSVLDID